MKVILHDTLATAPLIGPLQHGWTELPGKLDVRNHVAAADIGPNDAALIASAEISHLLDSHMVVQDVAVVFERQGMTAMRVPVRPDEIEQTTVWLRDTSGTAEILARATLEPFYGIVPGAWTAEPSAESQVVIVEGPEALGPVEAGFSEDLVRAWFILTGQPVVQHLFVIPKLGETADLVTAMVAAKASGRERRKELRKLSAERFEVDRDKLIELAEQTRYELGEADRRALTMLLQRGNKGSAYPYPWQIDYLGIERTEG